MVRTQSSAPDPDPVDPPGGPTPWGSPSAPIGQQLAFTAKVLREWFDQHLVDAGGSLTTWIVLSAAINSPESPSQSELAAYMGIGGPTLVGHIDRLESEGLLTRRRDDLDRRVTRIDITAAGRQRHHELHQISAGTEAELSDLVSERDEKILRAVLQRFTDHVTSTPSERGSA